MLVMPADHVIEPVQEFRRAVHVAEQMAEEHPDALVTFGIPPTYPGHRLRLHPSRRRSWLSGRASASTACSGFREKPGADLAEQFVASGEYFWNSGIFVWKAATILDALRRASAEAARRRAAHRRRLATPGARSVLRREYEALERISIDYAVMEARPRSAGGAGPLPLGRRRQLAGPGTHAPAGRRRQHRAGHALPGSARRLPRSIERGVAFAPRLLDP